MKRIHFLVALALTALLASSLPAIGAPSPATLAKRALNTSKKADKRAKRALKTARKKSARGATGKQGPQGAAGSAGQMGAVGALGATGPSGATGAAGVNGTARAYAEVNDSSDNYVAARTKGFAGTVVKPASTIGIYCLTPDPTLGIDPATVAAVAAPSFGNTTDHGGSAEVRGSPGGSCTTSDFAVHTYDSAGAPSDLVSFHVIVP
jgi:collagen triple helix repeat protein